MKGLEIKIKQHSTDMYDRFNKVLTGAYENLSSFQTSYMVITAAYCLKNEQLLNSFLKQSKINFEDINLNLTKHAIVFASRYSIYNLEEDAFENLLDEDIAKLVSTNKFDLVEFLMCLFVALSIFLSRKKAKIIMQKLENYGFDKFQSKFAIELIATVREVHELIKLDSVRTYEFIAREENI